MNNEAEYITLESHIHEVGVGNLSTAHLKRLERELESVKSFPICNYPNYNIRFYKGRYYIFNISRKTYLSNFLNPEDKEIITLSRENHSEQFEVSQLWFDSLPDGICITDMKIK